MATMNIPRRYDLDWLRVISFAILIVFHTGMMFNTWGWHVKNNVTSDLPELVMDFSHQWRMPLLFFISGAAVYMMLQKLSALKFLKNRMTRIFLPLLFGMIAVIPPQVYFERLYQGNAYDSFLQFYRTLFDLTLYPEGNVSWHHLWYLPYILTYSLLLLPFFQLTKTKLGARIVMKIVSVFESRGMVILWFIPLGLTQVILRPYFPYDHYNLLDDWSNFAWSMMFFLYGYILVSHQRIWKNIESIRHIALGIALVSFAIVMAYSEFFDMLNATDKAVFRMFRGLHSWTMIVSILGFGYRYLRHNSPLLQYANQAVYPFYILHQTITVAIGYYTFSWEIDILVKFLLVCFGTFAGCWIFYEGLIKKFTVTRVVFGMKPLSRSTEKRIALDSLQPVRDYSHS